MSKCSGINSIVSCWSKKEFEKLPLSISSNVNCTQKLQRKYYALFNHNNISALNNYAQKENLQIFFSQLENDIFHNTVMTIFHKSSIHNKHKIPLKLNINSKENFVESLRQIYKTAEEAVKKFSIKKTNE